MSPMPTALKPGDAVIDQGSLGQTALTFVPAEIRPLADFARRHSADQERRIPWREQNRGGNMPVGGEMRAS